MIETSRQFDDATLQLLSSCRGQLLRSYEAYQPFAGDAHLYKTVRLNFDDFSVDLCNAHEEIVLGPEYEEEQFAILSAAPAKSREIWHPQGKSTTIRQLDFPVHDVLVVTDTILLTKGSRQLNRIKLVGALLFEDENGSLLAFDRDIWSDEYLIVNQGASVSATTRDFRGDFVAEPPFAYQFGRDIQRLSNPRAGT